VLAPCTNARSFADLERPNVNRTLLPRQKASMTPAGTYRSLFFPTGDPVSRLGPVPSRLWYSPGNSGWRSIGRRARAGPFRRATKSFWPHRGL